MDSGRTERKSGHNQNTTPSSDDDKLTLDARRLEELAKLDVLEYERQRKHVAQELGMRASILDKEVAKAREQLGDDEDDLDPFQLLKPWPEPVAGDPLLRELCKVLRRHVVLPKEYTHTIALWVLFAHTHDAAEHSPILMVNSPIKECGKTTLMKLLAKLVPKPLFASNATPASIFRMIEQYGPTLLFDEVETWIHGKNELRGILDSGHDSSGAHVMRVTGRFGTWAPKVVALIGRMPTTLESRSIKIELEKKLPSEQVTPIPRNAYVSLHRQCRRWAEDNFLTLQDANPVVPAQLHNRVRDNWRPLLVIAEACGENWPVKARNAARRINEPRP